MNGESGTVLKEKLSRFDEILFALLFGSRAVGRPRPDSDWDIGVYVSDALTAGQRFDMRLRLLTELQDLGSVDVVILNDAPPLLAQRVLQGERIFVRDHSAYIRFFVRTAALAGDEHYWRQLHAQARKQRLEEGRFGRP